MNEMSLKCLICNRECSLDESLIELIPGGSSNPKENDNPSKCPQLQAQLNVMFIFRKLLQLPKTSCVKLITAHGNPSDWGQAFCLQCSGVIDEAQEVSQKIVNYLEKFKCLQLKIRDELEFSYTYEDDEYQDQIEDASSKLRYKLRKLCIGTNSKTRDKKQDSRSRGGGGVSKLIDWLDNKKEAKSASAAEVCPKPIVFKMEYTDDDESVSRNSPEPTHDDSLGDDFPSDCEYFDVNPSSVVKVLAEDVEDVEEEEEEKAERNLRNGKTRLNDTKKLGPKSLKRRRGTKTSKTAREETRIPQKEYNCPLCPKVLLSVNFLNLHYKKIHLGITSAKDKSRKVLKKNQKKCSTSKRRASRGERKYPFKCPDKDCLQHFPSEYFRDAHHKRKHLGIKLCFSCDKCGKAYDRNQSLEAHKKSCTGDGTFIFPADPKLQESTKFKCSKCPRHFPTQVFRDAHVKRLHEGVEKPFDCHMCDKQFQRYQQLSDHLKSIHHITKLDLDQSTSKDHSNDGMELNRTNNSPSAASPDPDNDWVPQEADELHANCSDSDSENETGRTVKRNSKVKGEEKKKQPEKRGKMIGPKRRKRPSILPTKKRAPITQIYRCSHEGCNKKFHLEVHRDGHLKQTHEGVLKPFICDHEKCDKAYGRYSTLQIHKESAHGLNNDTFMCENCGKTFFNPMAFKRHIYVHERPNRKTSTELNKHPCDECGKLFKGPSGVLRHKKAVHTDQQSLKCDECDLEFPTKLQLSFHRRTQHLEARGPIIPVKCTECDKSFNNPQALKRHIKLTHKQEFKFQCDVCKMGLGDKCSYDRHMLKHTGEKPFICQTCGKGLTRRGDLNRHMRLHTGECPFTCDTCGKSFTDSSKLTKHQKTHGEPQHVCDICNRKFYSYTKLRIHKNVHEPNHVGRKKRDPNVPKPKRKRKPKDKSQIKPKESTGRGRGRPRKTKPQEHEESDSEMEFEQGDEYNNSSNSYPLDMHQPQQQNNYQLSSSSNYNTTSNSQHQQVASTSGGGSYSRSGLGQAEYQVHQGAQSQSFGILTQTYMDPNMYLYHLNQMNPPNNNS